MWKPYLQVLAKQAKQALHVLDRFHITQHLNEAVDEVRRAESSRLRAAGKAKAEQLKHMRWPLLRRGSRVRGRVRQKLLALRSEEHTSELQSPYDLVCRLLLEKKKTNGPLYFHSEKKMN